MCKRFYFLISVVLMLSLVSITYGIQLGNFENPADPNHDEWLVADGNNVFSVNYSNTTGVTLGSYSLKVDVNSLTVNALRYSLTDQNMVDEFRHNLKISLDVTRLVADWNSVGGSYCELFLAVQAGSNGDPCEPNDPNEWDLWAQLSENAGWSPVDGNEPLHVIYNYASTLPQIDFNNLEYLNLILLTNWGGYNPGGIYYLDNIKMFGGGAASLPNPADGGVGVPVDANFSWTRGVYAVKHDVYFGTNFNDVNIAGRGNHSQPGILYYSQGQTANTFNPPALLEFNRTYYWRIDEVNEANEPDDIWKGDVWSFATMYLGGGLVIGDWEDTLDGWWPGDYASFSYSTTGATLNDKSLKVEVDPNWQVAMGNSPNLAEIKTHDIFSIDVTWVTSEWSGGNWAKVENFVICAENIDPPGNWVQIVPTTDTSNPGSPGSWNPSDFGESDTRTLTFDYSDANIADIPEGGWIWIGVVTNHAMGFGTGTYYFDNARLFDSKLASNPSPSSGATGIPTDPVLKWKPGKYAAKHDIYLGTDFFDVFEANRVDTRGVLLSQDHDANSYSCPPLVPGDTYFWRVDEVNDAGPAPGLWKGDIWNLTVGIPKASNPSPADGAELIRLKTQLRWKPDTYAQKHDVYFGNNFSDVNIASRSNHSQPGLLYYSQAQDANYYPASGTVDLDFEQTYYWRIDEVNDAIYPGLWKGNVWRFTTAPYLTVEDFEKYANTTALKTVWKTKAPADIKASSDIACGLEHGGKQALAITYSNNLSRSEAYADSNKIDNIVGKNWRFKNVKALSLWLHGIPDLRGSKSGSDPYTLTGDGSGINSTKYDVFYYLYTEKAGQITGQVQARVDSIENTSTSAMAGVMLRDTLNPDAVYAATVVTPDGRVIFMGRGSTGSTASASGTVSGITLPHWVRMTRAGNPAKVTAEHANDVGGNPDKWTQIGINLPWPFAPPLYLGLCVTSNNYGVLCTAGISQVTMQCPVGTGIPDPATLKDIGGYVYNDPEAMYVVLQDNDSNGIAYYENKDTTVTQTADWTEWRIDLHDFSTVDPCNVMRMYIGVGDKGTPSSGSGTVYIDDIRLYRAEFYEPKCPPLPPDLVRDGKVNYDDLKVVADNWLISDYKVTPVAPPVSPVAWYKLNRDPCDSAGPPYQNGVAHGIKTADYVTDKKEGTYALDLKGDANYIGTAYYAADYGIAGNHARTVTAWAKTRSFDEYAGLYEIGGYEQGGQDFSMLTSGEEPNVWRANHEGGPETYDIDFAYPSLNKWVHLAHTYDGTTVRVYADGYLVAARVLNLNTTNVKTFSIGRWTSWGMNAYFDGTVDDVRIYDSALSQANAAYLAGKTSQFIQPLEMLLTPPDIAIDLFVEDPNMINFRDVAEMGKHWGETQVWPTW